MNSFNILWLAVCDGANIEIPTMNNLYILAFAFAFPLASGAQTKLIFHKSHSGGDTNFGLALADENNGMNGSNFGEPTLFGSSVRLDSLIFINGKATYFVVSEISREGYGVWDNIKWTAGRNPIRFQADLDNLESIEEVRQKLERAFDFRNPVDEVKIVGFKPNKKVSNENSTFPFWPGNQNLRKSISKTPFVALWLLAALSITIAFGRKQLIKFKMARPN